jgi:hypothetical protein
MSIRDVHPAHSAQPIPRPRTAASDDEARETEASPDPWRPARGVRPSTEYWDVATASWRSRGPVPRPATGE